MAAGPVERSDVEVSELTALPDGGLLVLERVTHSTHIYRVRPAPGNALPPIWSDPNHRPTLEQAGQDSFIPLDKELVLSTDVETAICGDLEGMILIGPNDLLLSSDSDYGIEGGETEFWQVRLA